ncbi:MAG: hypothetical protein H0W42_12565 [Gemmatimonadaceae bacterium]|nr:hypothetical protein [Gemmatimonadaceae bacterium]
MNTQTRYVLTDDQLVDIVEHAKVDWANAVVETFKVFGVDLADPDRPSIAPSNYAIPATQWQIICSACMATGSEIGRVNHGLDWMNYGPTGYDPDESGLT